MSGSGEAPALTRGPGARARQCDELPRGAPSPAMLAANCRGCGCMLAVGLALTQTFGMRACPGCGTANVEAAKFCNGCGGRLLVVPELRRRFVTALFCDLVGSTGLGQRLDAEPLRRFLDRYFEVMAAAIERNGGTVEKFIGDAVVGAFGIPIAHEDDAFRAVRAALEMVEASAELEAELTDPGLRTRVRIAISSGEVFADEGQPGAAA